MRLAAQAKGGFYPTPERVVDLLAELIHTPTGYYHRDRETLRILDPCCGAGEALAQLAERMDAPNAIPIETYGVELHRDRAEEAEERLDHALASDLFATSIANGAFGLLLLNPPYDYDSEDKRTEHAFLTQTTRYLAEGGLLVFIVPRQRLAVSARYLSTHYGRMRCWAFPHPEREVFDQVVLMGYRKADPVPDAHARADGAGVGGGGAGADALRTVPAVHAEDHAQRRHPVRHPHRRSRRCCGRGEAVGAVDEHGDNRHPLARQGRPHPSSDAPAKGPHGDACGGGLPGQPLPGGGGQAHPGQGPDLEGDGHGGGQPGEGGPPGEAQDHRGRPGPQRRRDHRHRSIDGSPQEPRHKAPPSLYRETAGPRFVWTQHPYEGRKVVKMQITMTLEACCRCGQPIAPGEPAMQTASVDIIGGRAVSSPVKSYHLRGRCYDDAKRRESLPNAA